jgi:hypothetical protein
MAKNMSATAVKALAGKLAVHFPKGSVYVYVGGDTLTFRNKRGVNLFTHEGSAEDAVCLARLLAVDNRRVVVKAGSPGTAAIDHIWARDGSYRDRTAERAAVIKAAEEKAAELEKTAREEEDKEARSRKPRKAKNEVAPEQAPEVAPEQAPPADQSPTEGAQS